MLTKFNIEYFSSDARTKWEQFTRARRSSFWFGYAVPKSPTEIEVEFDDPGVNYRHLARVSGMHSGA